MSLDETLVGLMSVDTRQSSGTQAAPTKNISKKKNILRNHFKPKKIYEAKKQIKQMNYKMMKKKKQRQF